VNRRLLVATLVGLPLLYSCRSGPIGGGTSVGNPGETRMAIASGKGVQTSQASVAVASMTWTACDGSTTQVAVNETLDLLAAPAVESPAGNWCGVDVAVDAPLSVEIVEPSGDIAWLTLEVRTMTLVSFTGFDVDGDTHTLEWGTPDWMDVDEIGLGAGDDVVLDSTHELHDAMAGRAVTGAGLFSDDEGDGDVSDGERGSGSLADGGGDGDDDEDDD
jgi:hypothetical protein